MAPTASSSKSSSGAAHVLRSTSGLYSQNQTAGSDASSVPAGSRRHLLHRSHCAHVSSTGCGGSSPAPGSAPGVRHGVRFAGWFHDANPAAYSLSVVAGGRPVGAGGPAGFGRATGIGFGFGGGFGRGGGGFGGGGSGGAT